MYGIDSGAFIEVAHHDPELFEPGKNAARFITQDEESSGIIDAQHVFGQGWFLFAVQNHKTIPADPLNATRTVNATRTAELTRR